MPVSASGSTLCRHIWIKRLCHDLMKHQHTRTLSMAVKQTSRPATHVNCQPLSFLTPAATATTSTNSSICSEYSSKPCNTSHSNGTNKVSGKHKTQLDREALKNLANIISEQVKTNQIDKAYLSLAAYYQSGRTPSVLAYNHIIKALAKRFNNEKYQHDAFALVDDMIQHGIEPDSQTYIQLLMGYSTNAYASPTIELLQKMGLLLDGLLRLERKRRYARTHLKLKKLVESLAYIGHGALPSFMKTTIHAGVNWDISICNRALVGCIKGGYIEAANQLLQIMRSPDKREQLPAPDVQSYYALISGYMGRYGKLKGIHLDAAVDLFQKMRDDGVMANAQVYQLFLYAYSRRTSENDTHQLETLQKLWQAMMTTFNKEERLDENVLTSLLQYYSQRQEYSAMEQVYWDLREQDYPMSRPVMYFFHKAVIGFAERQELNSAIAIYYDILSYGHSNISATTHLLRACRLRGHLDMAQQILDIAEEALQRPASVSHYGMMVSAYVEQGQTDSAITLFDKMLQVYPSTQQSTSSLKYMQLTYQAMIKCYFAVQQVEKAEFLFNRCLTSTHAQHENKSKVDRRLINIMAEGYGSLGQWEKLEEFLNRSDVDVNDATTRFILIQAKLGHGKLDAAERDLNEGLKHHDVESLRLPIQAVLFHLALDGKVTSCESLAELLTSRRLAIEHAYGSLLVCYGRAGETVKLKRLYNYIQEQGLKVESGIIDKVKSKWLKDDCI